jgi:carboxypeptidase Q
MRLAPLILTLLTALPATVLAALGIEFMPGKGDPESDIGPSTEHGVAWAWLGHDGTD